MKHNDTPPPEKPSGATPSLAPETSPEAISPPAHDRASPASPQPHAPSSRWQSLFPYRFWISGGALVLLWAGLMLIFVMNPLNTPEAPSPSFSPAPIFHTPLGPAQEMGTLFSRLATLEDKVAHTTASRNLDVPFAWIRLKQDISAGHPFAKSLAYFQGQASPPLLAELQPHLQALAKTPSQRVQSLTQLILSFHKEVFAPHRGTLSRAWTFLSGLITFQKKPPVLPPEGAVRSASSDLGDLLTQSATCLQAGDLQTVCDILTPHADRLSDIGRSWLREAQKWLQVWTLLNAIEDHVHA